jgi:hypothetical protein
LGQSSIVTWARTHSYQPRPTNAIEFKVFNADDGMEVRFKAATLSTQRHSVHAEVLKTDNVGMELAAAAGSYRESIWIEEPRSF